MKPIYSNVHMQIFATKLVSEMLAKIIFSVFVVALSFASYAGTPEVTRTEACKIRMDIYTLNGELLVVQEVMNEEELSLREIKPGTYKMIISENNGYVLFNGRITVPAPQLAMENK